MTNEETLAKIASMEAELAALKKKIEEKSGNGYFLPKEQIGHVSSFDAFIAEAKQSHIINICVRTDGKEKWFEGDVLKYLQKVSTDEKLKEPEKWVNPVFDPESEEDDGYNLHGVLDMVAKNYTMFRTYEAAEDWAFVFKTMLEIAACDGVEPLKEGDKQCYITTDGDSVFVTFGYETQGKTLAVSPMFSGERKAVAALDKIGAENIMRMIKIRSFMEV